MDCKCSTDDEIGSMQSGTQTCLQQKMIFTANLVSSRMICDSIEYLKSTGAPSQSTEHAYVKEDGKFVKVESPVVHNENEITITWDLFTKISLFIFGYVKECREMAFISNSVDLMNMCLNSLQQCGSFEVTELGMKADCLMNEEFVVALNSKVHSIKTNENVSLGAKITGGIISFTCLAITIGTAGLATPITAPIGITAGVAVFGVTKTTDSNIANLKGK